MIGVRAHAKLTPSYRVVLSTIFRVSLPRHHSFISAYALFSTWVCPGDLRTPALDAAASAGAGNPVVEETTLNRDREIVTLPVGCARHRTQSVARLPGR